MSLYSLHVTQFRDCLYVLKIFLLSIRIFVYTGKQKVVFREKT